MGRRPINLDEKKTIALLKKHTISETARILGVKISTIRIFKSRNGLLRSQPRIEAIKDKALEIVAKHTTAEAARILGFSKDTIYEFKKKYGIKGLVISKGGQKSLLDDIKERVIALLKENTVGETAKILGYCRGAIQNFIKRHGIKNWKRTRKQEDLVEMKKDEVITLLKKHNVADTAKILGIQAIVVNNFKKKYKLKCYRKQRVYVSQFYNRRSEILSVLKKNGIKTSAKLLGVSLNALSNFVKDNDLRELNKREVYEYRYNLVKDKAPELLKTHTEIKTAKILGLSLSTLKALMQSQNEKGAAQQRFLDSIKDEAIEIIKNNNIKIAAKLLGVSMAAVKEFKRKHGIRIGGTHGKNHI